MGERQLKPHAIMISYPLQGHINPFVNLALRLASKGLTITFVNIEIIHHMISNAHQMTSTTEHVDLFLDARKSGLDIRYMTMSDGLPLEYDRVLAGDKYWDYFFEDFPTVVDEFVGKLVVSDPSSAFFLISDTFCSWPGKVAEKYNLVDVSFWTQPAMVFAIGRQLDLLRSQGHVPLKDNQEETVIYIPGVRSISTRDLMEYLHESDTTTPVQKISFHAFEASKKADFFLCNTVQELEKETLLVLNQELPTYAIGPLCFATNFIKYDIPTSLWAKSDCMKWLDSKPPGSVLYVSFGSLAQTNKHVLEEIANGLLLSKVNFIWVVRANMSIDNSALPARFEKDLGDQGLIVPWCDQNDVLSHSSVGGFITHCGWNSILESMYYGIPMIGFPFLFDQPPNRKLIVDDWKIGINLFDEKSVTREEVAEKIKSVMTGEAGDGLRREVKKVSKMVKNASGKDGSSERNLELFVKDLKAKISLKSNDFPTSNVS